jgi:hypothetical protein
MSFSWEPDTNVVRGSERLLQLFWTEVGMDNDDYEPGYIVRAKKSWVGEHYYSFIHAAFYTYPR